MAIVFYDKIISLANFGFVLSATLNVYKLQKEEKKMSPIFSPLPWVSLVLILRRPHREDFHKRINQERFCGCKRALPTLKGSTPQLRGESRASLLSPQEPASWNTLAEETLSNKLSAPKEHF